MLNLGDGKVDDAWQDTLAIFRLSRLERRIPDVFDFLIGDHFPRAAPADSRRASLITASCLKIVAGSSATTCVDFRDFRRSQIIFATPNGICFLDMAQQQRGARTTWHAVDNSRDQPVVAGSDSRKSTRGRTAVPYDMVLQRIGRLG